MKKILLIVVVVVLIAFVTNIASQAEMNSAIQNLKTTVTTISYAGEFEDIRTAVDEFLVLRTILDTEEGDLLAVKIDERLNNLWIVKNYCDQEISTLVLANEKNPYEKLQQICPSLENVSLTEAAQLFRLI